MASFKHIFAMHNNYSPESRWKKSPLRKGYRTMVASYKDEYAGYCSGMVVIWIKKSIATNGKGVRQASDLGDMHLMGVVQSAYARKTLFESKELDYGEGLIYLLQSQNLITLAHISGYGYFSSGNLIDWVLSESGHYILLFFNKDGNHTLYNGHAVGFRYESDAMEMFEPEGGLFSYPNPKAFVQNVRARIDSGWYERKGGWWNLHRVALDT